MKRTRSLLLSSYLFFGACLFGQAPTASLVGLVNDSSGAVLPGPSVTAVNANTNEKRAVLTTAEGEFSIVGLQPGTYDLTVEHPGFRTMKRSGLVLQIDQSARVEIEMTVGALTEAVHVTAA